MAYPSQSENEWQRAFSRADRVREKLGWGPGIGNGWGEKPKGMHWKTFDRLIDIHGEAEIEAYNLLKGLLGH